ncbi:LPS assembly protein LptD [Pontixanthobacter aestiaquae]|uniref:LPS-assembly protein LptD n=1 Tax=Pontixanthobacter aestiaquae TaxID=1509367 RepID=A0A844Z653_9SPHN|nr:LPS assembly protein LptD [Pontixanthobacter aestiaquae]MDN3644878.1 LPS assembly protein LptD [Pontixanthobacter aestiaquae]MXO84121.1 LPS assembly protein LptD [Pontixanthobacter aestiaquae]
MPPLPDSPLHQLFTRGIVPTGKLAGIAAALSLGTASTAYAQDEAAMAPDVVEPADKSETPIGAPSNPTAAGREIDFEANELAYDSENDIVTASGNVILRSEDQSVRAQQVTWNRRTGQIVASGDVRFVDEEGNQLYTSRIELTDKFEAGAMEELLLALREGGRLAARGGARQDDGSIILTDAAYSACAVVDPENCNKDPSWRITADRVTYSPKDSQIRFKGAYLELFGARLLPLPGLAIRADGAAVSGVTVPNLRVSESNGVEVQAGYYWRLADNKDLTAEAYVFSEAPPMVSAQWRHLTDKGAYQITGYATSSRRIGILGDAPTAQNDLRGYVFANGKFQFTPKWSVTGSVRLATDRTFLRRYDISREDRLRSTVNVERISDTSYFSLAGWATQTLRVNAEQGQVPFALPVLDYRKRFTDPTGLGGTLELQANTLAITRNEGQNTQRAFAGARWDLRKLTNLGQVVTLTGLVRGDVYHSDNNNLTETAVYRGNPGWQTRGIALGAIDMQWPFVGEALGGTQVFTPRVQIVASPPIRNLAVPNEDARAIDLEDSNLFALNRFPGYDRVEDGVRVTYGFDWELQRPGWRAKATFGQSYRLDKDQDILVDGTGLSERVSDFVGRTEVRYRNFLQLTHRYRLDKDNFAVRRNEFDATVGTKRTYAEIGYLRLNRDIAAGIEDLQDREELRVATRVAFAKYWSLFGSGVINLTNFDEDPTLTSDGFEPVRTRLGVAYQDDCLEMGLTWRRDYVSSGDAQRGNTFQFYFSLRNLGF